MQLWYSYRYNYDCVIDGRAKIVVCVAVKGEGLEVEDSLMCLKCSELQIVLVND
jgi:hypothetical protein